MSVLFDDSCVKLFCRVLMTRRIFILLTNKLTSPTSDHMYGLFHKRERKSARPLRYYYLIEIFHRLSCNALPEESEIIAETGKRTTVESASDKQL